MSNRTDVYRAITPLGIVEVEFPEDGGSLMEGDPLAVAYLRDVIGLQTGSLGMTMSPSSLEPDDFEAFCQPPGSHVVIIPPIDAMGDEEPGAVLDAVSPMDAARIAADVARKLAELQAATGLHRARIASDLAALVGALSPKVITKQSAAMRAVVVEQDNFGAIEVHAQADYGSGRLERAFSGVGSVDDAIAMLVSQGVPRDSIEVRHEEWDAAKNRFTTKASADSVSIYNSDNGEPAAKEPTMETTAPTMDRNETEARTLLAAGFKTKADQKRAMDEGKRRAKELRQHALIPLFPPAA